MCDVLIIGAGVAGVALASELAALGQHLVVVDAAQVCGGSSGLNAGGVRQQFSSAINIEFARRTVKWIEQQIADAGMNCGYKQTGYMFIARNEQTKAGLLQGIAAQNAQGVATRWLEPNEILDIAPGVELEGILGASFGPTDGYLDPNSFVQHIAGQARARGVEILTNHAVESIQTNGSKVTSVTLANAEHIEARIVVNCAGAWAPSIAALVGVSLPIKPWRSQLFVVEGVPGIPESSPFVIDFDNRKSFYHPEGGTNRQIIGMDGGQEVIPSWNVAGDQSIVEDLVSRLCVLNPDFESASIIHSWAGMLEITPDENPISDFTGYDNFYTMAGFSGHGLPLAPSLAVQVAKVLTGGNSDIDLTPYAFARFDDSGQAASSEIMSMR